MISPTTANSGGPQPAVVDVPKHYRPEIEGLRIVAALLVAVYHIWFLRVSGGVDVFFVVSGFLVTTSLLSRYNREGSVRFVPFALNLLKRLLPNALVVLLFVVVAGFFILPEVRDYATIRELFASLFYYENWQLAVSGTDYLDQTNEKSPVQHFWAMSIQGQFYIVLFLTVVLAIFITRRFGRTLRPVLAVILAGLLISSLAFSVYLTVVNQPWAYFDTRTRLWEFAIGGLLSLVILRLTLPRLVSTVVGWVGLGTLVSTGLLLDVGSSFPGWVALVPVGAAIMILVAGQNPTTGGVEKVLGSRPMIYLGGYSYGLYLWHWPLLSFYYVIFDTKNLGFLHGAALILAAFGLSYLSTTLVEKPLGKYVSLHGLGVRGFLPIIVLFLAVLISITVWNLSNRWQSSVQSAITNSQGYPGAVALQDGHPAPPELDPIPGLADIKNDKAKPYFDDCHQKDGEDAVLICEYGQVRDYQYTVALVGGSKSAHWLPSLETFASEERIRILSVTKSGCRLSLREGQEADCIDWNAKVVDEVAQEHPDLVVTLADTADLGVDAVPPGFLAQFARLDLYDLPILALRDTPNMLVDVPECLDKNGFRNGHCGAEREDLLRSPSNWDRLQAPPDYVYYVDYSDYFCEEDYCPAVIGNVVVYIDKNHITATFSRSLGPIIRDDVMEILETDR